VTVDYATADGSAAAGADYETSSGTLTFAPGETSKTLAVPVTDDALDESDETIHIDLSNPQAATIDDGQGVLTITDDDAPPSLSIGDASATEGTGGTSQLTFTVSLSAPSGRPVHVDAVTADASATAPNDYSAGARTLTLAPGATSRTFSVPVVTDGVDEQDESLTVGLESEQFAGVSRRTATGTIADDDEPASGGGGVQPPVQPPAQPEAPDTKAPGVAVGGLPATVARKALLGKGLSVDLTPDEAASFEVALVGKSKSVTLARAGDTTLADAELPLAAGKRTLKLKLSRKLRRAFTKKSVKLELRIVALDAAGNRTKVTKTVTVR
jgi:hypothetical protein